MSGDRRGNDPAEARGLAIFTTGCNDDVPDSRLLLEGARRHHPDATLYLVLADRVLGEDDFYPPAARVVEADALGIPDFDAFSFRHGSRAFKAALKPFVFRHLFRTGHDRVLYFDAAIRIFSRPAEVFGLLDRGASFVLTPHLAAPAEAEGDPDRAVPTPDGICSPGFLGARACAASSEILGWWVRQVAHGSFGGDDRGPMAADQAIVDRIAGLGEDVRILRDPTLNVSLWNVRHRRLSCEAGAWQVDGRPLGFFHHAPIGPTGPDRSPDPGVQHGLGPVTPAVAGLLQQCADDLRREGGGRLAAGLGRYGRFASGRRIPSVARRMFRDTAWGWLGNPFENYEAHLAAPHPGQWHGSSSSVVTNLMAYLRMRDGRLRSRFDIATRAGVEGYVDWFVRHGEDLVEHSGLTAPVVARLERRSRGGTRPPAAHAGDSIDVTVVGYLRAALGVGEAGRLVLRALAHAGVAVRGLETRLNVHSSQTAEAPADLLASRAESRFQIFNVNADQLPLVLADLAPRLRTDAYRILMPFWELSRFPDAWLGAIEQVDEIWAPSRFVQTALVARTKKPVVLMPLPLEFEIPPGAPGRASLGLPPGPFLFFFAFDFLSSHVRKNPTAVVAAFRRAFPSGSRVGDVRLVLKAMNAGAIDPGDDAVLAPFRDDPDIILIERIMTREETLATIAACDALVSLHRSEGLGLLVAEAMAVGTPVIATDYSATTELVDPSTGWPVDARLVPVEEGQYAFHHGQVWADPDIGHAAWQMRRVVLDRREAAARAARARARLAGTYSLEQAAARMSGRLRALDGDPG